MPTRIKIPKFNWEDWLVLFTAVVVMFGLWLLSVTGHLVWYW